MTPPDSGTPRNESLLSKGEQLLAATALIPVIGALSRPTQLEGLVYTFFVFVYLSPTLFKEKNKEDKSALERAFAEPAAETKATPSGAAAQTAQTPQDRLLHLKKNLFFIAALVAAGTIGETLLWISQLFAEKYYPTLMHPQLRSALCLALAYYLGMAVAWLILLKRFQYTLRDLFFLAFIVALCKQWQLGVMPSLCESLSTEPLIAVLTLSSLLTAGGSIIAIGFIAGGRPFSQDKKPDLKKLIPKYLITLSVIILLPELAAFAALSGGKALSLIEEKKPIWQAPLM
ncbi:MAG: hypothetical protein KGS72_03800 [Cyanobacteria bacterium REEB67]|nr:hypothetical protein [Cyanobacteria bacterium REEB67]